MDESGREKVGRFRRHEEEEKGKEEQEQEQEEEVGEGMMAQLELRWQMSKL
jgi:hypothetical protein